MTTLEAGFERKLRRAVMDRAEERIEAHAEALKRIAEREFRAYAGRNGYDIEHVWQDAEGPTVTRSAQSVTARIEWPGLTALFEYGVEPHVIEGNPNLAFEWAGPPEGTRPEGAPAFVQTDSVDWGSVTGGIPAARAISTALDTLRAGR